MNRFLKGLQELNLDPYYVMKNYVSVGGDGYSRIPQYEKKNQNHINEFKANFGNKDFPRYTNRCICNHPIMENCYISKDFKDYENIIIIGNCCYRKFINNKDRKCENCDLVRKSRSNLCADCKKLQIN